MSKTPPNLGICAKCREHDPSFGRCPKYPYKPKDWFDIAFTMTACVDFKPIFKKKKAKP